MRPRACSVVRQAPAAENGETEATSTDQIENPAGGPPEGGGGVVAGGEGAVRAGGGASVMAGGAAVVAGGGGPGTVVVTGGGAAFRLVSRPTRSPTAKPSRRASPGATSTCGRRKRARAASRRPRRRRQNEGRTLASVPLGFGRVRRLGRVRISRSGAERDAQPKGRWGRRA